MKQSPPVNSRAVAAALLSDVLEARTPLDQALTSRGEFAALGVRDRAFARLLLVTVLRRLVQIDDLISGCLDHPLPRSAAPIRQILRLGTAELVFLGKPAYAAVDASVRLANTVNQARYKGLVNAVLRRLAREGTDRARAFERPNVPGWLIDSWRQAYGTATTSAISAAHLLEPPLDISVKGDPEDWRDALAATRLPSGVLRRPTGGRVADLPGYAEGVWWVQDAAAALPARLLGDIAGKTVIDLCAAPGGKTAQLATLGARVIAVEKEEHRLERLRANLTRLRLAADTVCADATLWRPDSPADAVLLDAPCSATGTIRRRPDVAWLKGPSDVRRLCSLQDALLDAAVDMVRPGGTLVYCVCSLQTEECETRITALRGRRPFIRPVPAPSVPGLDGAVTSDGYLRTLPSQWPELGGLDGFFAARLDRDD